MRAVVPFHSTESFHGVGPDSGHVAPQRPEVPAPRWYWEELLALGHDFLWCFWLM